MSSPGDHSKQHALSREWAATRAIVIGGLVVAVAVGGYFAYRAHEASVAEQQALAPPLPKKIDAKTVAHAELVVCSAELAHAKDLGILPQYARLDTPKLARTAVAGRYVCVAATHLTKYFIAADLHCNSLMDAQCMSVYRIALQNGSLLYSRPQ
jgi:hypothetical protein